MAYTNSLFEVGNRHRVGKQVKLRDERSLRHNNQVRVRRSVEAVAFYCRRDLLEFRVA